MSLTVLLASQRHADEDRQNVLPYARDVYDGTRAYPMPMPLVIGLSAIARIVAVGPDAVRLTEGQLVLVDCYIRGRDDAGISFLSGLHDGEDGLTRAIFVGNSSN